ncbi:MAG TPA: sigma-70 family RNA polymerase sigma factor [Candidatus Omnitrophota bacterium]|nr:sigma-70 family RNA polymerase sigma factor [Candidatus Omnitrophota bacterium]
MLILKELVNRCITKDKSAWSEFVLRFRPLAERCVRFRLSRHNFTCAIEDIKDIVQGIFLDIWEKNKLELVKDQDKISGWLSVVSQNAAISFIRSQAKFSRQRSVCADEEGGVNDILNILPSGTDLSRELAKEDLAEAVDKLIAVLEPREKLILKLNIQHNQTHREIADFLNIPINTVSSILRRTMIGLRENLKKKGYI